MKTDIYGNALRAGHCELHPQVAEKYPCTLCLKEREVQQQLRKLMPNYILESQAQAAHQAGHALGLPAGTDITTGLVPAVQAIVTQRDDLLAALMSITDHFAKVMGGPMIAGQGVIFAEGVEAIPTIKNARDAIAKAKGGAA